MPLFMHEVVSKHTLHGPKGRRQVFHVKPGEVVILKWEGLKLVGRETMFKEQAQGRYKILLKLGWKSKIAPTWHRNRTASGQFKADARNGRYAKQYGKKP